MAKWSKEALENFRKARATWKAGRKPLTDEERSKRGLHKGNWKQRNPERHAEHHREYVRRNPEKIAAQNAIGYALRRGHKPNGEPFSKGNCGICGASERIEAHHFSYSKKHWFDIVWVCHSCHVQIGKASGQVKKCDYKTRVPVKKSV